MADSFEAGVLESSRVSSSRRETVDVVVIGTGCGGAVMASRLARAGKSVLMLERGGFYLPRRGDFDQREDDMFARIDGGRGLHASESPVWEWTLSAADALVARDAMKKEALVLLHAGAREVITPDPVGTRISDTIMAFSSIAAERLLTDWDRHG